MTIPAPMTELDAVNILLGTIGEAPVNTLSGELMDDVAIARSVLSEVSREIQSKGWHFNREYDALFQRDVSGEISIPQNIARFDVDKHYHPFMDVTQRGNRAYNKKTRSFVFDTNLICVIVVLLPFDELPASARYYITVRAARKFSNRYTVSTTIYEFTAMDESQARADFLDENEENADRSILQSPDIARRVGNRPQRRVY